MAVFSKSTDDIVCVLKSKEDERLWFVLHTDIGPLLLCAWYRPPLAEISSTERFRLEYEKICDSVIGVVCVGDHNFHNRTWPRNSRSDTPEGKYMETVCNELGLRQLIS